MTRRCSPRVAEPLPGVGVVVSSCCLCGRSNEVLIVEGCASQALSLFLPLMMNWSLTFLDLPSTPYVFIH